MFLQKWYIPLQLSKEDCTIFETITHLFALLLPSVCVDQLWENFNHHTILPIGVVQITYINISISGTELVSKHVSNRSVFFNRENIMALQEMRLVIIDVIHQYDHKDVCISSNVLFFVRLQKDAFFIIRAFIEPCTRNLAYRPHKIWTEFTGEIVSTNIKKIMQE